MNPSTCTHTHPAECHNVAGYVCPDHFSELMADMMCHAVVNNQASFVKSVADLVEHQWLTPAVATLCGFVYAFAVLPGETMESTAARVTTDRPVFGPDAEAAQDPADHQPWLFRAGLLTRAAIFGDGDTIFDTIASIPPDPRMDARGTLSILASLAHAAHQVIDDHPQVTSQTVALGMMLGGQTYNAQAFNILGPVITLAESMRTDTDWDARWEQRLAKATPQELTAMVGTVGRALGQSITPEGPEVVLGSSPSLGMSGITGILNWRDERLDNVRTRRELCLARAIRVAVAFARDDGDHVAKMIVGLDTTREVREMSVDIIGGTCSYLAMMVNAQAQTPHG